MAEVITYGIALVVGLRFAWDYLLLPLIDNAIGIRNALWGEKEVEEKTPAMGFHMPWHDDDEYYEDEE